MMIESTPVPSRTPEWASWDDAIGKARELIDQRLHRDAAVLLTRAVGKDDLKPQAPLVLKPASRPSAEFGYLLPLRVPPTGVGGYVHFVFGNGESFIFRVLAFKPERDGGNDYVPVDEWLPVAPIL